MSKKNIKLLHCADHHLRDSQYARTSRREDFLKAFSSIVDVALDNGVHAVLCCGDLFNGPRISPYILEYVENIHVRCLKHKLPFYVISGNHDFTKPHWAQSVRRPDDAEEYGIVFLDRTLTTIPGTAVTVFGAPAMSREELLGEIGSWPTADIHMWHGMVYDFLPKLAAHSGGGVHLHEITDILKKCKFLALGDLHIRRYECVDPSSGALRDDGDIPMQEKDGRVAIDPRDDIVVGYPGSTELCYANEDTQKTVTLVELDSEKYHTACALTALPVVHRTYLKFRVVHEGQIEDVLTELSKHSESNPPVVILYYNPNIQGVKERIRSAIPGPEKLIQSIPVIAREKDAANIKSDLEGDRTPEDFIPEFITSGAPHTSLGRDLLNPDPDTPVNAVVDDYIQKRKGELNIA